MPVKLPRFTRSRWFAAICGVLVAVAIVALSRHTRFRLLVAAPIALGLGALTGFSLLRRTELRSWWPMLLANACITLASMVILHLPLCTWIKLPDALLYNAFAAMLLLCLVTALTANVRIFGGIWLTLCVLYGIANCAVLQFSENAITLSSFRSIGTAISVANNYRLVITRYICLSVALYGVSMLALLRLREDRPRLRRLPVRLAALLCAVACFIPEYNLFTQNNSKQYKGMGQEKYGIINELLLETKLLHVSKPDTYSDQTVVELSAGHAATPSSADKPHVIVVLLEAFSDLTVLGDLRTNVDFMPYTRSLDAESIHGHVMSSTLSGGTARSEWEILTGNTMAFLPDGAMPYEQYVGSEERSVVKVFQNAGYHTMAMHPYSPSGYHRSAVWNAFGFDDCLFLDDLEWDGTVRKYVSDSAFVHQLIRQFEDRPKDKPLFLFGLSMQNHGGYTYPDFSADVHIEGLSADFPEEEQYLSLMKLSDDAVRELIEYFRNCDEKVQILFFGDHQPRVSSAFTKAVGMKSARQRYLVPFVLWNNYDQRSEEVELTSFNYMMPMLFSEIGMHDAPYFNFLNDLRREIPSISVRGCWYDGKNHSVEDSLESGLLGDYSIFQYGNMFSHQLDDALFVGSGGQ